MCKIYIYQEINQLVQKMHNLWFYAKCAYYNLVKSVSMEIMLVM